MEVGFAPVHFDCVTSSKDPEADIEGLELLHVWTRIIYLKYWNTKADKISLFTKEIWRTLFAVDHKWACLFMRE